MFNISKFLGTYLDNKNTNDMHMIISLIILIGILLYITYKESDFNIIEQFTPGESGKCDDISKLYPSGEISPLHNIDTINDSNYKYNLLDYYIKTAYNCCSVGDFVNDYVDTCILEKVIAQGARCLDFEIYSLNNQPIIATSSVSDYSIKQTYNYVPLDTALKIINSKAFSTATCPNPNDPLLLNFRIKSKNKKMFTNMAKQIRTSISDRLLPLLYGNEYDISGCGKNNIGNLKLSKLLGKIVIIADKSNNSWVNSDLEELVNIGSNSIYMRSLRNYDVIYTPDHNELIEFNKKGMTITMPDISAKDTNIVPGLHMAYGCQMVGMSFQNFDTNLEHYTSIFDTNGTAFKLKPEKLRYIPVTVEVPSVPDKTKSAARRDYSTDYYSFSI